MRIHELKISKWYAKDVLDGDKSFEVRYNDRGFQKGDLIHFTVLDDGAVVFGHPLSMEVFEITYVHSGLGLKEGYVALSIKIKKEKSDETETHI